MRISFVIPTRDRVRELAHTLARLSSLDPDALMGAELIVVDNGSRSPQSLPKVLDNGVGVRQVLMGENLGAGARNVGVEHARGEWVIMLDDDSNLCPGEVGAYLGSLEESIGAVGGEILLPSGDHEAGGLPEVVVGCGCAIRRDAFIQVGGYDASFGYYAEEYDLCAKLISAGYAVTHTKAMRFEHRKTSTGRNMDEILFRLVRNNGWVIQRYAPHEYRESAMGDMLARYEQIAHAENAQGGYARGADELCRTQGDQPDNALSQAHWDRFTGAAALRECLVPELDTIAPGPVAIVGPPRGKGLGLITETIQGGGCWLTEDHDQARALVIGTLSPGPMLQAQRRWPTALSPWTVSASSPCGAAARQRA